MMGTFFFIVIVVIELVVVFELRTNSYCVVTIKRNVFATGTERRTSNGYRFCAYTGIPYARSPVEKNRFEMPKKIALWKGAKQFTEEANACVQMSYETFEVIGSEDCLFLNIYTIMSGNKNSGEIVGNLMPVLFWIHGGSFNIGSASSDLNRPDLIIEKEIVVVTINYRLGPFGFLSYKNVAGNVGLHDQRMALKWINKNIIHFGGNKSRITLAGWSSGGASVSYHIYANKSKRLFDKAIIMSGNMLNPWAFETDVVRCTNELFKKLNIQNSTYAIKELKAIHAYDLIPPIFSDELKIDFLGSEQFCFVPTIDEDFVIHSPHIISHQQPPSNLPILIGTTSLESEWILSFESSNSKFPNSDLNVSNLINKFMSQTLKDYYNSEEGERFVQKFQQTIDMTHGIYSFIQHYIEKTKQEKVFLYRFDFDATKKSTVHGSVHGDELKYLFKDNFLEEDVRQDTVTFLNKVLMQHNMVALWTNFIKFSNPTPNNDDSDFNVTWPPFNIKEKLFVNIDYDMTVDRFNDNDGAFRIWDSIYQCTHYVRCDELNEYLFNNKSIEF